MQELRANTQVIVHVGPFPDVGDGFTPQTDIDISTTNEAELLKHGASSVTDISGATWAAITNCRGWYNLTLTTSHANTEGMLEVVVQDDSDCLPVCVRFMVLSEAAWDSKYVAKDDGFMDVNVKTIGRADTQETEANNLESACSNYSATRGLTGTALPAAVADAAGGVPVSDAGGLDIDNLTVALTTAGQQDVAQLINARPTWYVNKSGSDGDSGTSWDDAFLTVGQAVSSASAGDKIVIGPGTYSETVDSSGTDNLEFVGAGLASHFSSGTTHEVGNGTTLCGLKVECTGGVGLTLTSKSDVRLKNVAAIGTVDGISAGAAQRLRIDSSYVFGTWDAINLTNANDWLFTDTILETDGTYGTSSRVNAIYCLNSSTASGVMEGGMLVARRNDISALSIAALGITGAYGSYILRGVQLIAEHQHASASGPACGVSEGDGTGFQAEVLLTGCSIYTNKVGAGNEYHLNQAAGVLAVSSDTQYDRTKTNGTIINLGEEGADLSLISHNLDHLMKTAVNSNADMTTEVPDGTVLSNLMSATSDTSTFVVADDSLQGMSEGGASAAQVWAYVIPASPSANTAADYLQVMDAVVGGVTNTDTPNEVAFKNRSSTERRRITFGSDDGSRTASTIS